MILEFTGTLSPREIAEQILSHDPRIVGLSVYIWNVRVLQEVVSVLKKVRPELIVVLGGPEVTYEPETSPICQIADFTIQGEGELVFSDFCREYLASGKLPATKFISAPQPGLNVIQMPYREYTDEDVRNRIVYVEASRGCPYRCEYCLSSMDSRVRSFDRELFLREIGDLIDRGARHVKFLDRTFNLSISTCTRILSFFLEKMRPDLFLHFEMVPDRLPVELRELMCKFPPGSLQFEVGIQTWNPEVARNVSRRQDYAKIIENLGFLKEKTHVHVHADLIAGLPGENWESFANGFDAVAALEPGEIQLGILKRLKGTPISRHDQTFQMVYQEQSPYTVLSTRDLSFAEVQQLERIARFWDLIANKGNFESTMELLKEAAAKREDRSLFGMFDHLTRFLSSRHPGSSGVALLKLVESVWIFLTEVLETDRERVRKALVHDYSESGKRDVPRFLQNSTGG